MTKENTEGKGQGTRKTAEPREETGDTSGSHKPIHLLN